MRRSVVFLTLLFSSIAFGQGGFGGGLQGRNGGDPPEMTRRPEDEDPALWNQRTAIVTPGDRVEYKLDLRAGETVFAAAESDAFDPGLRITDAAGKKLAENDDRAEGDQSPFLAFRAPKAGEYRLQVLGYRSASGGRFTLKTRSFLALDAPRGTATVPRAPQKDEGRIVFRITAKKGEAIDFHALDAKSAGGESRYLNYLRVVGPTGVPRNDLAPVDTPDRSPVFRAQTDGDYYVEYEGSADATSVRTDLRVVETVAAKSTDEVAFDLAPGELKLVEFPVAPEQIVRTVLPTGDYVSRVDAPSGDRGDPARSDSGDPAYGENAAWTWFRLDRDSDADVVRVFHGKGVARFALRSTSSKPQRIVLRNSETLPEWTPDQPLTGDLPIGAVRLFRLRATPAELMKVFAKGERFQVRLDLHTENGARKQTLMDRIRHVAEGDLFFAQAETNLVRLTCDGYGGAGTYTLRRDVAKPTPFAIGQVVSFSYDPAAFALYVVDLEAGKRYELASEGASGITILDAEGQGLGTQGVSFDATTFRYLVPQRSGPHRIWIQGGQGTVRFSVRPYVPRGVGG